MKKKNGLIEVSKNFLIQKCS